MVFCAGFAFNDLSTVFVQNDEKVIYNGNKNFNNVSLMINVYWGNEFIEPMLEIFQKNGIKKTWYKPSFFKLKFSNFKYIYFLFYELAIHLV